MKKVKKKKDIWNNKGFSLIELLVAITLFAIIIAPVLNSFVTSARINRDARKTMIATDVAQTIMEGFADKSYEEVQEAYGKLGLVDVSGNDSFTTVSGNLYNMKDSFVRMDNNASAIQAALSYVSNNEVTWQGANYTARSLVSNNDVMLSMNYVLAQDVMGYMAGSVSSSCLYGWTDPAKMSVFLVYSDIQYEGYHFDAVVSVMPNAANATDLYYTYSIMVALYDYDVQTGTHHLQEPPVMVMQSGISYK